jgi:hypothetical protein
MNHDLHNTSNTALLVFEENNYLESYSKSYGERQETVNGDDSAVRDSRLCGTWISDVRSVENAYGVFSRSDVFVWN